MGWEYIDLRPVAAAFLSLTVENPNLFKLTPSYLRVTGRRRRRRRPALRWGSDSRGFRQVLSLSLSLYFDCNVELGAVRTRVWRFDPSRENSHPIRK